MNLLAILIKYNKRANVLLINRDYIFYEKQQIIKKNK